MKIMLFAELMEQLRQEYGQCAAYDNNAALYHTRDGAHAVISGTDLPLANRLTDIIVNNSRRLPTLARREPEPDINSYCGIQLEALAILTKTNRWYLLMVKAAGDSEGFVDNPTAEQRLETALQRTRLPQN